MTERHKQDGAAPSLLSAQDAAALLGLSPRTLYRYERRGFIEAKKTPGGRRRYRAEDIERLRDYGPLSNTEMADTG